MNFLRLSFLIDVLIGAKHQAHLTDKANCLWLGVSYFFYFGLLGVFVPYIALFLDERGYDSYQIGLLLAFVALARILGPGLWANVADNTGKLGEVLRLGCLLAFLVFFAIYFVFDFWLLTLTFCFMMMFWTAVLPQLEVITVKATENTKGGYGRLRLWGSVGFIVCSIVIGKALDYYGTQSILIATNIVLFGLYISSLFVVAPKQASNQASKQASNQAHKQAADSQLSSQGEWKKALSVVFILFIVANLLLQVSFGSYYNFFSLYMQDLGYSGLETGLFIALGVTAEIFIFIYANRLLKRFNVMSLLGLSFFFTSLRWLALAYFASEFWIIVLSQTLHAFSFGLTHVASVYFMSHFFPANFQSRAQALYVSTSFGMGSAIGSIVAGKLWMQGLGAENSFLFSATAALIGALVLFSIRHATKLDPLKE